MEITILWVGITIRYSALVNPNTVVGLYMSGCFLSELLGQ